MRPNGDIRAIISRALHARGLHTFRGEWCKGRAEKFHVQEGVTITIDKATNAKADHWVHQAKTHHHKTFLALVANYRARFTKYEEFIKLLQEYLFAIVLIAQEYGHTIEKKATHLCLSHCQLALLHYRAAPQPSMNSIPIVAAFLGAQRFVTSSNNTYKQHPWRHSMKTVPLPQPFGLNSSSIPSTPLEL